jgi:hypothetical protein
MLVLVALRISKIIVPPFPNKQPTWLGETKPFTDSAQITQGLALVSCGRAGEMANNKLCLI